MAILAALLLAPLLVVAATTTQAAAQENVTCYLLSDGLNNAASADNLYLVEDVFGTPAVTLVGPTSTDNAEAFAIRPGFGGYAWDDADGLVTVDLDNGMTADAGFDIPAPKVEGLTWANVNNADTTDDILYVIRTNGAIQGYTPSGADAGLDANVAIGGFTEGTDIAWDAAADQLYASRANGDSTQVVTVSPGIALAGDSADDLEGLGFAPGGELIGTTGGDAGQANNLYSINKGNGDEGASLVDIAASFDSEDVDCISPDLPGGTVSASSAGTCVGLNQGQITVTVMHTGGDPVAYEIFLDGASIGTGSVSAATPNAPVSSASNLADGSYAITATADGELVSVADSPVVIDCGPPDSIITATAAFVECANGAGNVEVDITFVSGDEPATYTIGWLNPQQNSSLSGTVAAGSITRTISGLVDQGDTTITVTNTTGGAAFQALSETVSFDCPPPELSAIASFDECEADAGNIEVIVTYVSGSELATYEIAYDNGVQDGTLTGSTSSGSIVRQVTGLIDGTTTITVTNTSVEPPVVVATQAVAFDCDQPTLTATVALSECTDDRADVLLTITNESPTESADVTIEWDSPVTSNSIDGSVSADTTVPGFIRDIPDTDIVVTVTNVTGDGETIVLTETLTVDCVPAVPGEIAATAVRACVDNSGAITVSIEHVDGELPVTYRVEVTNQNDTAGAIALTDDPVAIDYAGLADGTYVVSVFDTAVDPEDQVLESTLAIVCSGGAPDAVAIVICSDNDAGGGIQFTVTNPTGATAVFELSTEGQAGAAVVSAPANSTSTAITAVGLADGSYDVSAEADNLQVYSATLTVDCSPDPVASVVSVDCATQPGAGVDRVVTIRVDNTNGEVGTDLAVTFNSNTTTYTVNQGATLTATLDPAAPGSYPLSIATAAGLDLLSEIVEVGEPCLTADPAGFCSVFNPSDGKVRFEFNNTSTDAQLVTVFVIVGNGTLLTTQPANGGREYTIAPNFLTNITLDPVYPDGTYEAYAFANGQRIAAEEITLACQNPAIPSTPAATIGAGICPDGTIPVVLETSGGNTSVQFVITVDGGVYTLPNVSPPTLTVNANSMETVLLGPLASTPVGEAGYQISVAANGVTLDNDVVRIPCSDRGIPEANVSPAACGLNDDNGIPSLGGFFDVTLAVMGGGASEDFIVAINGNPFETVTVPGSSTTLLSFGPLPDDVYTVSISVDGTEVIGSPESVTIDCRSVTAIGSCDSENVGSIVLTFVNESATPVVFTGTVDGLVPASIDTTVAPGASQTDVRTPLSDDTYTVAIAEDGIEVFNESIALQCLIEGTPSASIGDVECVAGGTIEVELTVEGGTVPQDFVISVDGEVAPNQPTTVPADSTLTVGVGAFPLGTYQIDVTADGNTLLIESVDVSCVQVETATECVDGNGRLAFTYTNETANQVIFSTATTLAGQTQDNAGAAVAAGSTATVTTSTPLPDGTYVVRTTANGVEVDGATAEVDCAAGVVITDDCLADNGVIRATIDNSTDTDTNVELVITRAANGAILTQTAVVAAGDTDILARSGRPDGTYTVEVSLDGTLVLTQTVLVRCDEGVIEPGAEVIQAVSCLAGNGRVDTNIVNTGDAAATYRIEFQGLSPRENSVAAGDWWRMPITGRQDGSYLVVVKRDGVTVSSETLTISCDTNPPVVDDDEVRVVNACRAGNGYLLFQFVNDTAASKGYVIEFQGVTNRSTTAAAYGQAVRAVTGRPDGTYAVTIRSGGAEVETLSVTVDCDA